MKTELVYCDLTECIYHENSKEEYHSTMSEPAPPICRLREIRLVGGQCCEYDESERGGETLLNEQRTGHWIKNENGTWKCSECGSWVPDEQHYYARYCLHCGTKMEGEPMSMRTKETEMLKSCGNCVNCDKVKPEGKDEFWACDEYGAVYLTAPANCTPPNDCACDFWTDDPAERHKRYNNLSRLL